MSAVDHTLEEINQRNAIPCRDGSQGSSIVLNSITEATTQVVDGTVIITELVVDVVGCGDTTRATVNSTVVLQENNTFSLPRYTYEYNGGIALTSFVAMVMIIVATAVLLL